MAREAGHAAEFTGNHIGDAKGTRGFLHRGDVTFMIDGSGDLKVTIEAMDPESLNLLVQKSATNWARPWKTVTLSQRLRWYPLAITA